MQPRSFQIEKNIPAPYRAAYPFKEMKIGDSFLLPAELSNSVRTAASQYKRKHPEFNYTARTEKDGVRIWRVKAGK